MDYKKICDSVCDVARKAAEFIASERRVFDPSCIEYKGYQNMVSYVDKQAEMMIVSGLLDILPAQVLGEEGTTQNGDTTSPYKWIVDPLDGTTNFIHDMPPYCVSIALAHNDVVVVGVVYVVTSNECFYAWKGSKAYMNDRQITVSEVDSLENSLVISGVAHDLSDGEKNDFSRLFDYFNRNSNGARRIGSAAANLAYVAAGRAECFYQINLSPWDVAAGALIVQQAGGVVTDFNQTNDYVFGKSIIATNAKLYHQFKNLITK